MVSFENARETAGSRNIGPVLFIFLEAIIFAIYYLFTIVVSYDTYLLYLIGMPAVLSAMILLDHRLAESARRAFISTDFLVLVGTISFWFFLYAFYGFGREQVLFALYAPVLLEEVNFRFVLIEYLGNALSREKAVIIQGILFGIWYAYYELFYQGTWPNVFLSVIFIFSMMSIGLIYGVVYYLRKSVYISMSIHLSLLLMALPIVPWYVNIISYLMGPT
ncbi:hypothetical protein IX51_06855 [uncultured archaeon]|nr:hypothetical protein IX51_06855 [uncultured archaeon]